MEAVRGSRKGLKTPEKRARGARLRFAGGALCFSVRDLKIALSPLFPLPFLCFLLFGRRQLVPAALLAATVHECGHLLCLYALGGRAERIALLPFGGEIVVASKPILSYNKSAAVCLAGPLSGLLCAPLFFLFPLGFRHDLGLCALALSLFNLLPASGLDGGELLENLLSRRCSAAACRRGMRASGVLSALLLGALFFCGLLRSLFNPTPVMLALYLLFSALLRN